MNVLLVLALFLCHLNYFVNSQAGPGPSCLCYEPLTHPPLLYPLDMRHVKDGSGRMYVASHDGYIWIFEADGTMLPEPFANLTGIPDAFFNDLNGFSSFVFHPDYINNGRAFLYFSTQVPGAYSMVLAEFLRSETNPDQLDMSTERRVLVITPGEGKGHDGGIVSIYQTI